jgi:hypothetical protein
MSQNLLTAKEWTPNGRYKVGDIVYQGNSYYINKSGINAPFNSTLNWLYIGEVIKGGTFALKDASNLSAEEIVLWKTVLGISGGIQAPTGVGVYMYQVTDTESEWINGAGVADPSFTKVFVATPEGVPALVDRSSFASLDKLNDVAIRGSYSSKPISFLSSGTTPDTGSPIGAIGVHLPTYSYYFGDFSQTASGLYNVSLSYGALQSLTSGEYNIGIGVFTGKTTTTGKRNIFLGGLTGQKNTTGNFNVFTGMQSGNENTTGYKNTYIGTYSGYNSNSNLNTLIGYKAGNTTAMGDRNLFLGSFSGQGVTGQNNIIFGIGAGFNDAAISNKLIIHNNNTLSGYGPDDTQEGTIGSPQQGQLSRALVTGDFVDRWFRINGYIVVGNAGTNVNDILIDPSTGIRGTHLYTMTSNFDYVQRGFLFQNYYNSTQIDSMLSSVYKTAGSLPTYADLISRPPETNIEGMVFNILDTGENYVWVENINGTSSPGWDKLSGLVDLSSYLTITDAEDTYIPYTGTSQNITGYLRFSDNVGIMCQNDTFNSDSVVGFKDGLVEIYCEDTGGGGFKTTLQIEPTQINVSSTSTSSRGITGAAYYGANILDNDYVQKKYLTDNFLRLSGENVPEMSGDIRVGNAVGLRRDDMDFGYQNWVRLGDGEVDIRSLDTVTTASSRLVVGSTGIQIVTPTTSRGLTANYDLSANIDNLDYTQKIYVDNQIAANIRPYTSYVCLLRAGGTPTPSPNFVVLENNIGAIVWARTNVGEYIGTLNGAFPIDKVAVFASISQGNSGIGPMKCLVAGRANDNSIYVTVQDCDTGNKIDLTGEFGTFEVRVYN